MNISQLRETVTELLDASPSLIGSYILPDGSSIPAVYVSGRQGVPGDWKATGLEVTIQEFPRLSPRPGVGTFQQRKQWTVVLVDYDTNSTKLSEAAERMSRRFPDASMSSIPETDVVYGQYRITIPDLEIGRLIQ